MKQSKQEFLEIVCNLYIIAMFAVLPLYTKGTYFLLGDTKYLLFRNITVICLGIFLAAELFFAGYFLIQVKCRKGAGEKLAPENSNATGVQKRSLSIVDIAMLLYGGSVLLSFLCSPYRQTAWTGYKDWYMGAFSQLMFVGIYFLVSRGYQKSAYPIYLGEAALLAVTVIGLLQRLNFDPFHLHASFLNQAWEKSHLLSTIGNINWLCGYYSVMLAFPVAGFLYGKNKWKTRLLYVVSVLAMLLLCVQGSDSGLLIVLVCLGVGYVTGLKKPEFFRRSLLLNGGLAVSFTFLSVACALRGGGNFPADGYAEEILAWKWWLIVAVVIFLIYICLKKAGAKAEKRIAKNFLGLSVVVLLAAGSFYAARICGQAVLENYTIVGNRPALWKLSLSGFTQADFKQKLLGAGPDCFAEYIYTAFPAKKLINAEGHWADAVFANAHSEWLNHLVNIGILGVAGYLAIFLAGIKRYRGMLLGVLAILCYGAVSLVSFQQVMSTPYLFIVLGICESRLRQTLP